MVRTNRIVVGRRVATLAAALAMNAGMAACGPDSGGAPHTPSGQTPASPIPAGSSGAAPGPAANGTGGPSAPAGSVVNPAAAAAVSEPAMVASATAANQFAFELFRRAASADENAILSPLSIRHALALAWAGAGGQTQRDMAAALFFGGAEDLEHLALAALVAHAMARRGDEAPEVSFASRLWVQRSLALAPGYQPRLESAYGTAFDSIDFRVDPDAARRLINGWVADQTRDRVPNLLPDGSIGGDTRLILANAVYLKARWVAPFEREVTRDRDFTLPDGQTIQTPTMRQTKHRRHAVTNRYSAVELPYQGSDLAMLLVMPNGRTLAEFEADLDAAAWGAIVERLESGEVSLSMPTFEFEAATDVADPLKQMGMEAAFSDRADFSRMVTDEPLMIGGVFHGAFLRVDEDGTEAAAATAINMVATAAPDTRPPVVITLDRPFMLAIRDRTTGAILFLGHVVDPR